MKKRLASMRAADTRDVVFQQALLPMEAAVLPARERVRYGALSMIPRAFEASLRRQDQRAKIWVR